MIGKNNQIHIQRTFNNDAWYDSKTETANLLIEQGENIKCIQSQLGHSSPTGTLNVYAHLMKPINQEAAIRLENAIFGAGSHKI